MKQSRNLPESFCLIERDEPANQVRARADEAPEHPPAFKAEVALAAGSRQSRKPPLN
jgi:hypothetical protein